LGGYDLFVTQGSAPPTGAPVGSLRPGSVVPLEPVGRPPVPSRRWAVALAVPVALVVSVAVAVVVREYAGPGVAAAGRLDPGFTGPLPGPAATPEATPGETPAGTPPVSSPAAPPVAPAGYQVHHEAAGYWVAIPKGWEARPVSTGGREWWGDLSRSDVKLLFVTIKSMPAKRQTARAVLTKHENVQKHSSNIFYHRIQLAEKPRLTGATSVADLEFTDRDYAEGAQTWHFHTLVRAVVTPDNTLYMVQFMILHNIYHDEGTTEGDWQLAAPTVRKILASFRLG
jgi:hypothetical protein